MEEVNRNRRLLIQATASVLGGSAAAAFARPAGAFEIVPLEPGSGAARDYADRCGGPQEHAALVQKLRQVLTRDPALASTSAVCPICGCPVAVAR